MPAHVSVLLPGPWASPWAPELAVRHAPSSPTPSSHSRTRSIIFTKHWLLRLPLPPCPAVSMCPRKSPYPVISIIDFHHARGPEVEHWIGVDKPDDISEWPLLPFLALADGAHSSEEDFSFFTLKHDCDREDNPTTLFGISCTRQLDSRELIDRPAEVTRSTVQKAVVVIADSPTFFFGHLKQQLSAVTQAWFAQRNFEDLDIIRRFQESLQISMEQHDAEREQYVGLSLREIVHEFRHQTLVLFKCMLLQPKMLFFAQRCEELCMVQFSLLSLIPGLLRALQDCSDPELNSYEKGLVKPTSVRTSDKKSLLAFMGLPLQIFGKGSLFGPYTPLQQLDVLADVGTKSYMVGSTNSLLLQQRDRYSDILINLDENTVNITSTSLRAALGLTAADRRFIDHLTLAVMDSWDDGGSDPSRPKTMGFVGSEDYIRLQFEEYILSMVSAVKYHLFLQKHAGSSTKVLLPDIEGDPSIDFGTEFVEYWQKTDNFRIFQQFTESEIFDIVPPRHVMAGGLSIEDVQRRLAQQVQDLHLDEKVTASREAAAKALAAGRTNISTAFMNISKNVERFREQRRLQAEQDIVNQQPPAAPESPESTSSEKEKATTTPSSPVVAEAQSKAGAYMSSWAQWAAEKRKNAWSGTAATTTETSTTEQPAEAATPAPAPAPAKPSLFSRWSRSSVDLPAADKEKVRNTSSVDLQRETKWNNDPSKLPASPVDKDLPISPVDKKLPEPPVKIAPSDSNDKPIPEIPVPEEQSGIPEPLKKFEPEPEPQPPKADDAVPQVDGSPEEAKVERRRSPSPSPPPSIKEIHEEPVPMIEEPLPKVTPVAKPAVPAELASRASTPSEDSFAPVSASEPEPVSVPQPAPEPTRLPTPPAVPEPEWTPAPVIQEPVEEPIEKPAEEPVEEPFEDLIEKPVERPVEEPVKEPVDESVEKPIEKSIEKVIEKPVETPVEYPVPAPVETSIEAPIEASVKAPVEVTLEDARSPSPVIKTPVEQPITETPPPPATVPSAISQSVSSQTPAPPPLTTTPTPIDPAFPARSSTPTSASSSSPKFPPSSSSSSSPKFPTRTSSPSSSLRSFPKKPALVSKFEQAAAAAKEASPTTENKRTSLNPPPKRSGGIAARAAMFEKK
ncbi:hypothetical protein EX30DRAFT_335775 [Ascodesmis nigricans]|uniref:UDENN domain-containing protein n=1 Tax=Ascodesmis nigricans TaxID=341454 RepID=A0A4S2MPM6_9PEZI|nr:hypothetical protein EX30DRAFT_335775 [Ascodesmis nigricans]